MDIEIEDIIDNGITYYVIHIPIEIHFKYVKLWMALPNPAFHSCSTRPSWIKPKCISYYFKSPTYRSMALLA